MDPVLEPPLGADDLHNESSIRFDGPPLLPLIAAGDKSAVDRFIERYGGLIWTLTKKMTRSSHDAEDLVQEIFIELWKNAAHFRPERGSEISFISIIARRRLLDRLRKTSAQAQVHNLHEESLVEVPERQPDSLEVADEIAKVRNCMEQLSPNAQGVLKLILQDGLSHQEVSISLSLPLGSVKSFARRGLLSLRECVQRPFTATISEAGS
jgi:RNA polymerase sigma-70 factor (ECF subfamily)